MSKDLMVRWLSADCMSLVECGFGSNMKMNVYRVDDVSYVAFAGGWRSVFDAPSGNRVHLRNWFTV